MLVARTDRGASVRETRWPFSLKLFGRYVGFKRHLRRRRIGGRGDDRITRNGSVNKGGDGVQFKRQVINGVTGKEAIGSGPQSEVLANRRRITICFTGSRNATRNALSVESIPGRGSTTPCLASQASIDLGREGTTQRGALGLGPTFVM